MNPPKWLFLCLALASLAGCAAFVAKQDFSVLYGPAHPKPRWLSGEQYTRRLAEGKVSFGRDVKPILDSRCVVCHGCYDAPCQLKLESPEGLDRGASKTLVYDGGRMKAAPPTRLFIDAQDTGGWRDKGFFPVLNERMDSEQANTDNALLYQMLLLKQEHPLPTGGRLPDQFEFGLERELHCPAREEFQGFAREHPDWGMPYGFPGLRPREFDTLTLWLKQGAMMPPPAPVSARAQAEVKQWEAFLNGDTPKQQLVSRYLYEHLFAGHLHFKGHTEREFFRLVRSTTPPGAEVREIATPKPYDDPGTPRVYYRLLPLRETVVDKSHLVYELGAARLRRLQQLFLEPGYAVGELPGYAPEIAANPFKAFAAIPPRSRYQFMLDDAYFFVAGYMKGPVCRGQVALNVIRDRFWVAFFDPEQDAISNDAAFLAEQGERLRIPSEKNNDIELSDAWSGYADIQKSYLKAKHEYLNRLEGQPRNSLAAIWDGGGRNHEALLTAFRHFDSASLTRGFVGDAPLTGWLLDYPLLERIHYLLVAGFNVFGNVKHQLATRTFMDMMRLEGENNFLSLLPARERKAIHDQWNRGALGQLHAAIYNPYYGYGPDSTVAFRTADHKRELFELIRAKVAEAQPAPAGFDGCPGRECAPRPATALEQSVAAALGPLEELRGGGIQYLPELAYLRVHDGPAKAEASPVFSLVKNEALSNVSLLFMENLRRLPGEDTLTVVPELVGSYPNFFFDLDRRDLPEFVGRVAAIKNADDVAALVERFGVRRNNPRFWEFSDFFNQRHRNRHPVTAGWFDLNRYDNL